MVDIWSDCLLRLRHGRIDLAAKSNRLPGALQSRAQIRHPRSARSRPVPTRIQRAQKSVNPAALTPTPLRRGSCFWGRRQGPLMADRVNSLLSQQSAARRIHFLPRSAYGEYGQPPQSAKTGPPGSFPDAVVRDGATRHRAAAGRSCLDF